MRQCIRLLAQRSCILFALGGLACWALAASAQPAAGAASAPVLAGVAASGSAGAQPAPVAGSSSATLEQCVTASSQPERSATFSAEMTAMPGTGRMTIRLELQERLPGDALFHNVAAPGLGVWRAATPGVKVYRYIKQVTDLSAPATYRAAIRFRWLNTKGKLIRSVERRTAVCVEPRNPAAFTPPPVSG